jgi:hypothetical protein
MMTLLISIAIAWLFYAGFALCISVYRQWLRGSLNLFNKLCFGPVLAAFYVLDFLFNFTVLWLIWGDPPVHCYTISDRFEVYHKVSAPTPRAKVVATWTCEVLLNTIDPTGDHC